MYWASSTLFFLFVFVSFPPISAFSLYLCLDDPLQVRNVLEGYFTGGTYNSLAVRANCKCLAAFIRRTLARSAGGPNTQATSCVSKLLSAQTNQGMHELAQEIDSLFDNAGNTFKGSHHVYLEPKAARIRSQLWQRLLGEGGKLVQLGDGIVRSTIASTFAEPYARIRETVRATLRKLTKLSTWIREEDESAQKQDQRISIKLGCGSPATLGCSDMSGANIRLKPLVDTEAGALMAMDRLGIDVLGLPGARLPSSFQLPIQSGTQCACKWAGGTSHASVAMIWRCRIGGCITPRHDLGSCRRLWCCLHGSGSETMWYCVLYLPPEGQDAAWMHEVRGLDADLETVSRECPNGTLRNVLMMGDWNFQPADLGAGVDISPAREQRWRTLRKRWSLILHNPSFYGSAPVDMMLPIRRRPITIHAASTHHGSSSARAIDLTVSSCDLGVSMCIHNGLSCLEGHTPCNWPQCSDYTYGDHFLSVAQPEFELVGGAADTDARFPLALHEEARWRAGLDNATRVLQCFNTSLAIMMRHPQCLNLGTRRRCAEVWLADSIAWLFSVITGVVRDAWVMPSRPLIRTAPRTDHVSASLCEKSCVLSAALSAAHRQGEVNDGLLRRCYRLLRKTEPRPTTRMLGPDGLMDEAETHAKWCTQLKDQSNWGVGYDGRHHAAIEYRIAARSSGALFSRGRGEFDQPVSDLECREVVNSWDASNAMPPDLVPRAAYQCFKEEWWELLWRVQYLMGPSALAVRPALWRLASLFVLYKRGDPALPENFRMLFVKTQMGLLQEGILFNRLAPSIRSCCLMPQSAYTRSVDDTF